MDASSHPLIRLMRRYVEDYTNRGDLTVIPEILSPKYQITISGDTLDYREYVEMVEGAYGHFPNLQLVVHDLFTDGERLAMRFSEHAGSPRHGGNRAVWQGIGLYRWDGRDRLTECVVEQDFYGRRQQLAAGRESPLEERHPDPWSTRVAPPIPEAESVFANWLLAVGNRRAASDGQTGGVELYVNGFGARETQDRLLDEASTEIMDVFSVGDHTAARVVFAGRYAGGLYGIPDSVIGSPAILTATAVGRFSDGLIRRVHVVTDRFGLRARLKAAAEL
jgi:predicted ester cyclase